MSFSKDLKQAQKTAALQQEVILELESLVKSIERGEKMILELKEEMESVSAKHSERKTTRDDIAYLEDLLHCAKKKLAWEKHMDGLAKRTPAILERVLGVVNDPRNPPAQEIRAGMMISLQGVQAAMERLEKAKVQ